jgi:hypothetical protein
VGDAWGRVDMSGNMVWRLQDQHANKCECHRCVCKEFVSFKRKDCQLSPACSTVWMSVPMHCICIVAVTLVVAAASSIIPAEGQTKGHCPYTILSTDSHACGIRSTTIIWGQGSILNLLIRVATTHCNLPCACSMQAQSTLVQGTDSIH